jgi:homogentisate 1,2-dioxygenase
MGHVDLAPSEVDLAHLKMGPTLVAYSLMNSELQYQSGFGHEFASEALEGALPKTQIQPQRAPFGLYVEELNGTAFTAPRGVSRSTWSYRIRPSTMHKPFAQIGTKLLRSGPFNEVPPTPNQLRWRPMPIPTAPTDFIDGIVTLGGNGEPSLQTGAAIHVFAANAPMTDRYFYNADGEMVVVLQQGRLRVHTELGVLDVVPGELLVLPRGVKFRVDLPDGPVRGYICENYGPQLRLPELGPIGTFGLANARDFLAPVAAYEDVEGDFRLVNKYGGLLWEAEIDHSPLDVVAWRGNYVPYKYDLNKFQCINTVTFDHPDPSIYCVLAAPTGIPGTSGIEIGCIPPRWSVAEHTFRPPPFHRNVASEFVGLIKGQYIGKAQGFDPGSASLHNCMSGHGPDAGAYERGREMELKPVFLEDTLTFIFETQLPIRPTKYALETETLERDYYTHWLELKKNFDPASR